MNRRILIFLFAILCNVSFSQDSIQNPLINSGQLLAEGISYQTEGLYDSAITKFNKIDRNDTNYTDALSEKALTFYLKKDYAAAINTIHEALKNPDEVPVSMYLNWGNALNDSGNFVEAENVFKQAIQLYPYFYLLHSNYAFNLFKQKKYHEAELQYQKAINLNPYYSSSYLGLGTLYYTEGRKIPAMMALGIFLTIEPNSGRSFNVTKLLKKVVDGSIDMDKDVVKNIPESEKQYSNVLEILESKVANDNRYKTGIDVNDIIVRQFHVVLTNISCDKNDTTFFSKNILSLMKNMFTTENFEPFVYSVFSSYNNKKISKWLKKNDKKNVEFRKWISQELTNIYSSQLMNIEGEMVAVHCFYRNNGQLLSFGKLSNTTGKDLKQGTWKFLSQSGNVEIVNHYNDNGDAEGLYKAWNKNRRLIKELYFKNNKADGSFLQYYDNGTLQFKTTYSNGLLEGMLTKYYISGALKSEEPFSNDTINGLSKYYNSNGFKTAELKYVKGKIDSIATYYYPSGKKQSIVEYKNNVKNGDIIFYYENGQIQSKAVNKDDKFVGSYLSYWENGKPNTDFTYSPDGKIEGVCNRWDENGILKEENFYSNGKLNGKTSVYTDDSKLWYTVDYRNGTIKKLITYTQNTGSVCAEFDDKGKRIPVTFMTPKCQKNYEGMFFEGKRDGAWKHFYTNGNVLLEETYNKGKNEGLSINYFKSGTINSKVNYSNDMKNGYYNEYYQNGEKMSEGWYRNGEKQGYWFFYGETGIKVKELYYLNDKMRGYQKYFTVDGKLDFEMHYQDGLAETYTYYDTTGLVAFECKIERGTGTVVATYFNGTKRFESGMKYGCFDGSYKCYFSNGKILEEGTYNAGFYDGDLKLYHRNGNVYELGTYANNSLEGKFVWNYENGKPKTIGYYKNGKKTGTWEWFDEIGRKTVIRNYKDDKYDGEHIWYDSTGTEMLKRVYEDDDFIAFSYLDKSNTVIPNIPVQDETVKLKAFYPNGNVSVEMEYQKGVVVGEYKNYYQSGKIMEISPYKNNRLSGLSKTYYENGNLRSEENYTNGVKQGICIYYRPDGTLKKREQWYLDDKHGVFEYYDTMGKLVKKEKYVYNELFE